VLLWAHAAHAQSAETFYFNDVNALLAQPSGPAAELGCSTVESNDGLLNAGDVAVFPGNFSVAPGASVVLEDTDGTQGTLVDGVNAVVTGGNIRIALTGDPLNVAGGDGVLSDDVCDSVVTTTGVAGAAGISGLAGTAGATGPAGASGLAGTAGVQAGSAGVSGVVGVLPDTGGLPIVGLLGAFALLGTGVAILRRTERQR